jgi:DNA-directed RNA polymerase specialized sigma24 family protein
MAEQVSGAGRHPGQGREPDEHALLVALAAVGAQLAEVEYGLGAAGEPVPLHLRRERDRLHAAQADAFRAWSAREARRLRAVLRSALSGDAAALDPDDLLQDVFLRVTQQAGAYQGTGPQEARGWTGKVARNLARDARKRHQRKEGRWDDLGDDPEGDGPAGIYALPDGAPGADAEVDAQLAGRGWEHAVDHCEHHAVALVETRSPAELHARGLAENIGSVTSVPKHIRAYRLLRLLERSPDEAAARLEVSRASVNKLSARGREGLKLGQARAQHPTAPEPDPPSREVGRLVPLLDFDALTDTSKTRSPRPPSR